jgi:hypothetical protein
MRQAPVLPLLLSFLHEAMAMPECVRLLNPWKRRKNDDQWWK